MKIIAATFVGLAAVALLISPALAQLRVSPGSMDMLVPEGQHALPSVTVTNDSDKPMDFEVKLAGYGQGTSGSTEVLEPDTNPLSAVSCMSFAPAEFSLAPGETQEIDLTVSIPQGIDGGRYAVVLVIGTPAGGQGITTISRMGILVRLTVAGSHLIREGSIELIGAEPTESGNPILIEVTYANQGNVHCRVQGSVTIFDAQGDVLDVARTSWAVVIPGYSRELVAEWIPGRDLDPGTYSAQASVYLEDGTLLDQVEGSFEVGMPYVPPTPPVTITLTATSASTLQTDDGRFSISFPQGAVFSDVDISLRDYPLDQLPPLPSGYGLAATAFRVDGLPGLLAKEATVTVKYLSADLESARGDASRLKLARWDIADDRWTVLKTDLDRKAMTISADTNQLSIWAIMVGPPATVNWPLIGGVVAGVIAVGLLVYFLVVRRRGTS
jgi:hypothetical protein